MGKRTDDLVAELLEANTRQSDTELRCERLGQENDWLRKQLADADQALASLSAPTFEPVHTPQSTLGSKLPGDDTSTKSIILEHRKLHSEIAELSSNLSDQVTTTLAEAENAVGTAISVFFELASDARRASETAQVSLGASGESSIASAVQQASEVIENLLLQQSVLSENIREASARIGDLPALARDLTKLLDEVNGVASQTAMLSINASIEASRSGHLGNGMRVIAVEVRRLADRSRKAASSMRSMTASLSEQSTMLSEKLSIAKAQGDRASASAEVELRKLLDSIHAADNQTQSVVTELTAQSARIGSRHQQVVQAFQFHDLLRQRLEHVIVPLQQLSKQLRVDDGGATTFTRTSSEYPRETPQMAIGKPPSVAAVSYDASASACDVTLF
jgi:methyl-accepting chemotaxis protein